MRHQRRFSQCTIILSVWLGALSSSSCLDSSTAVCPSGLRCLQGHRCVQSELRWTCIAGGCGDGIVSGDEKCDDGNLLNGDGCNAKCGLCGDGIVDHDMGEECDDGNDDDGDSCTIQCRHAVCGDGLVFHPVEQCDGGEGCTEWCEYPSCDNDLLDGGETDIDCGGECNKPCVHGQSCTYDRDCYSGLCREGMCEGRQLAAGSGHVCLLQGDGKVACWGKNAEGRLGYDHAENIGDNECPAEKAKILDFGDPVVQLVAGIIHTCALLASGEVYCWGMNWSGQLGTGTGPQEVIGDDEDIAEWTPVDIGGFVVGLAAQDQSTCALMRTGYLRCWGLNNYGQLGLGHTRPIGDDEAPSDVEKDVYVGDGMIAGLSLGGGTTCVVANTSKRASCRHEESQCELRCWGKNHFGQLGLGHTNHIGDDEYPGGVSTVPLDGHIVQVQSMNQYTCALSSRGTLHCWGRNDRGQLGLEHLENIGDDELPRLVSQVELGSDTPIPRQVAGWIHTCVLLETGSVRCWGRNDLGRLGYGDTRDRGGATGDMPPPEVKVGGAVDELDEIIHLAVGWNFTCALRHSGVVQCWGKNDNGVLGRGIENTQESIGDTEHPEDAAHQCPHRWP